MAATYVIGATGVAFAQAKSMIAVFNGTGSGRVVRVYRGWMLNTQPSAVAGGMNNMELRRITTGSGGTSLTPMKLNSTNESFPAQIVVSTNQSVTVQDLIRRWVWSTDEPLGPGLFTVDELETVVAYNMFWSVNEGEAVEPITLREGYGLSVQCSTAAFTVGTTDLFFEVSLATT